MGSLRAMGFVLVATLLAACGGGGDGGWPPPAPVATTPEAAGVPELVAAGSGTRSVVVDGMTRTFIVRVPPNLPRSRPVPIIYALHGRFGTGATMASYGFDALADSLGFVAVYPDGYQQSWNDGRSAGPPAVTAAIDDLAFFDAMDADLRTFLTPDERRIAACGMSNGAIMCHRLAAERSARFSAVGACAGTMASEVAAVWNTNSAAISCIAIHSIDDSIAPYAGGMGGGGGTVVSVDLTLALYRDRCGISATPACVAQPNTAPDDGCTVERASADNGDGVAVELWRITGGGHSWPSHPIVLDLGNVCFDIDATSVIVEFLLAHPKPVIADSASG